MTYRISRRSEWGFDGWLDGQPPARVDPSLRRQFMIHYEGGNPVGDQTGPAVPLAIHHYHRDGNGWAGIGYGFVVTQAGEIFEGRGWEYRGAHCEGFNSSADSVQGHIGGSEEPSAAMRGAIKWLYGEGCRLHGRTLTVLGHRDGIATLCPGEPLTAWARAGMPIEEPPVSTVHVDSTDPTDPAWALVKRSFVTKEGALWLVADFAPPSIGPGDVWIGLLHYGTVDSDSVRRAQRQLKIEQTGNYDDVTDAAVRAWQKSIGNPVDSVGKSSLGPLQAARLFAGSGDTLRPGVPPRGVEVTERAPYPEGPQNVLVFEELPDPDHQDWKPDLAAEEGEGS